MPVTAAAWLAMFVGFSFASMNRPVYGICLYMMTFYAFPLFWWWGNDGLLAMFTRWSLLSALIFLASVCSNAEFHKFKFDKIANRTFMILFYYALNATLIHFAFASNPSRSWDGLTLLWKQLGLAILMYLAVQSTKDFKILIYAVIAGALYVCYEIVWNDRGRFVAGRLEGIQLPGVSESNHLSGLLSLSIPLAGAFLFLGRKKDKFFSLISLVLIFEVILRCGSRAAYLSLLVGGARLFAAARGKMRRYAIYAAALALVAVAFQARDEDIINRFWSIFVSDEERDESAESRIVFVKAAMRMIASYPMGSGAEAAFKSDRGSSFLGMGRFRAVHNGYLDITAAWGIQGMALYLAAIWSAWNGMRIAINYRLRKGQTEIAFLGICIEASLIVELIGCGFHSTLDAEWIFWLIAIMLNYSALFGETGDEQDVAQFLATKKEQPSNGARQTAANGITSS